MKKTFFITFIAILSMVMIYSFAEAKVGGVCSNCHTMHSSQDGTDGTPNQVLLTGSCFACHSNTTGTEYTVQTGNQKVPQVNHPTTAPMLAGGNFKYIVTAEASAHNVKDLIITKTLTTPPGDKNSTGIDGAAPATKLTCAGQYGCHGNRTVPDPYTALKGGHHGNTTVLTFAANPTTVATSYRFLMGTRGGENDDATGPWKNSSATVHNEYSGKNQAAESTISTPGTDGTISGLCGECHGTFHRDTANGTTSPFKRHPADIKLTATGEYASYTAYSTEAPVGRLTIASINTTGTNDVVTPGTDIVICLSCHYAHGGPNADLLRWNYANMIAGDTSKSGGCFTCHTAKND